MNREKAPPAENLRKHTEKSFREGDELSLGPSDMKELLHDLRVHQIELEMQNEELKRSQAETEESRARYADLYDFAPVGYFTFDGNGLIKEVNLTGAAMLGVARELLINRRFSSFVDPRMRDAFSAHYQEVLHTGKTLSCELVVESKTCARMTAALKSVLKTDDYMHRTVRTAVLDITEQKLAESNLREANTRLKKAVLEQKRTADALAKLEAAIKQANEAVIITDQNWSIEYVNRSASALFGYELSELIGMNIWSLRGSGSFVPGKALPPICECEICSGQYSVKRKDETTVQVEGNSAPVFDREGVARNCVLVLHDISEKVRLERELRQAQKMEALGTFAAGIAHDFNNILAGVIGFTELVLEDTDPVDPRHAKLSLILKGANRGRDLARQILAFGRSVDTDRKPLSLSGVTWETYKLLRASIPSTVDIKVSVKTDADTILGDHTQIQQVLMNLGSNAAYAMREKGGLLEITLADVEEGSPHYKRLHAIKPEGWLRMTVRDTGCGMSQDVMDRIFDPFFTTKGPREGTGMGLSVVHGIVKEHGGDIVVESKPGKGSAFHLFFPSMTSGSSSKKAKEAAIPLGKASILFVDDEELLVEMNSARLERLGYKVTTTTDSAEALRLFKENPAGFDILITDFTMPHMTGIDLAKKVLKIRKGFPVILCTGVGEEPVVKAARDAGIGGFLSKPFDLKDMAALIAKLAGKNS